MQQLDAQGPAIVERVSTQFADVACSAENARQIVEALHNGTEVRLSADGKTATFTPTAKLGYGEAYIAMALAAEALRAAGVSGCATPDQWKAALMGGPLAASGTTSTATSTSTTASSSSHFPGILTLRQQGQGWGQVAHATNVELGQIVSSARSSLNLQESTTSGLSPTGRSSSEFGGASASPSTDTSSTTGASQSTTGTTSATGTTSGTPTTSGTSTGSTSDTNTWADKDREKGKGLEKKGKGDERSSDRSRHNRENDETSSSITPKPSTSGSTTTSRPGH